MFYLKEAILFVGVGGLFFLLEREAKTRLTYGRASWRSTSSRSYKGCPGRYTFLNLKGCVSIWGSLVTLTESLHSLVMTLLWARHLSTGNLCTCLGPENSEHEPAPTQEVSVSMPRGWPLSSQKISWVSQTLAHCQLKLCWWESLCISWLKYISELFECLPWSPATKLMVRKFHCSSSLLPREWVRTHSRDTVSPSLHSGLLLGSWSSRSI